MTKIEARKKYGVTGKDARRLERALCTLADFEGVVKDALTDGGIGDHAVGEVCAAIRKIIDGDE